MMAEPFSTSMCFRLKLLRVLETAGQHVLTYTLHCGTPGKSPAVPLDDYLTSLPQSSTAKYKTFNSKKRKGCFNKTDKKQISGDASCSNFDISLLCKAIPVACEGWHDPANKPTEELVKKIKDTRNDVVHGAKQKPWVTMNEQEYLTKLADIRDTLIKVAEGTRAKYKADVTECDEKKRKVTQLVDEIRNEKLSEAEIWQRSVADILPYFKMEADEELRERLNGAKLLDPLRFLSGHENRRVDVQEIFSDIIIREERSGDFERLKVNYLQLLTHTRGGVTTPSSPHLVLVEGDAGSGKTTLLTYTLSEYLQQQPSDRRMQGLDQYDLVLWVVCREETSHTLEALVRRLLSDAYYKYGNLLMPLLRRSSVLVLIDGLDEQTEDSQHLVKDIVNQCKDCATFTLLSTTRPEAVQTMKAITPGTYRVSHLKLEGVSVEARTELALRHYRWQCGGAAGDEARLRQVMQDIGWKELFRLPLNLLFLATFFHHEPQKLGVTITQTELYQNILDWCVEKLRQRLLGRRDMPPAIFLHGRIMDFLTESYEVALKGLLRGKVYLSDEDLHRLSDSCSRLSLPEQEVLPAFYSLRRETSGGVTKERYFAPHKGLQDFFAAKYILGRLSSSYRSGDIHRVLRDSSSGPDLPHLRPQTNLLCHLLGLLNSQKTPMVAAVEETVDLLHESDIQTADHWLEVLSDTGVHSAIMNRVAHHINSGEYDDYIGVSETTVHMTPHLLPLIPPRKVSLQLDWDVRGLDTFFQALGQHRLTRVFLYHHYQQPRSDRTSADLLRRIPKKDLETFKGHLDAKDLTLLPESLISLALVLEGDSHARSLLPALQHIHPILPKLLALSIHLHVKKIPASSLMPLPECQFMYLFISGVGEGEVEAAVNIATALNAGEKGYKYIAFIAATFGAMGCKRLIEANIRTETLYIPDTAITEEQKELLNVARTMLGCKIVRFNEAQMWNS